MCILDYHILILNPRHRGNSFFTFTGPVEGLAKLREMRGGDKYSLYNSNMLRHAEVISTTAGTTLIRMNLDKSSQPIAQVWRWRVEDPASFATEFSSLIKAFPQQGYLSLGQFTHGTGSDGESHYVYTLTKIMQVLWVGDQKLKHNNKLF